MASPLITINGATRIGNKLRALARTHPDITDPVIAEFMQGERLILSVTPYPPARAGQTYQRTGALGRGFKVQRVRAGVYQLINTAARKGKRYAQFVIGKNQAWMHKGRWWIAAEETQKRVQSTLTPKLASEVHKIMVGNG